jgi:hypothetical protein
LADFWQLIKLASGGQYWNYTFVADTDGDFQTKSHTHCAPKKFSAWLYLLDLKWPGDEAAVIHR